jgi:tRNA(adenine34) deaminase
MQMNFDHFMGLALIQAEKGGQKGEVPIGALIVAKNGEIVASSANRVIELNDPTAHAEILAIREAANKVGNYRLTGLSLFVTIEPCIMCMGAVIHARLGQVIFGARDPKWGALGSIYDLSTEDRLNHRVSVVKGVGEESARRLIQSFFQARRDKQATRM